ncbi:stimulator of interferon genes protein-like isoform X2 [Dendronephthya gigantea]|uniref:stimulator of interferon genes protein-like isoform X2 n=1 Tax=Dendronephthya gigantea TaxID=151771 RepID=UPI001069B4A7|nr:stimulator of interferon genes protein-like isoform X2 [Dendronephthya gigantea]
MVIKLEMHKLNTRCNTDINNGFGQIPEKRRRRAALLSVLITFVIMVILLAGFTKPSSKLYAVNTGNSSEADMKCKREKNEHYHVGVFIWSLSIIGIILGELLNRLCLIFEEYFHLNTRYRGSKRRMLHACFNDISIRTFLFGILVVFVIITTTLLSQGTDYLEFEHVEIILSGLGSCSLVRYLLGLNSISRVQLSSLMENNNRLVANGLAWSYFFGYLKIFLPRLNERIEQSEWKNTLSSKKLYILMPRDCFAYSLLSDEDKNIELVKDASIEYKADRAGIPKVYRLNVYKINGTANLNNRPLHILAEYASPLSCLHEMSHEAEARLSREDRDEQAKLFLRTLKSIMKYPPIPEVPNRCKLVPYARCPGVQISKVLAEAVFEDMEGEATNASGESVTSSPRKQKDLVDLACYHCQEKGHKLRKCPRLEKSGMTNKGTREKRGERPPEREKYLICYHCNEEGHKKKKCPHILKDKEKKGGRRSRSHHYRI